MAVREERDIIFQRAKAGNQPIGTLGYLVRRFTARTSLAKQIPVRLLRANVHGLQSLVVMSERGRQFLREVYHVPDAKIDVIPHGIPDMPFADPNYFG